MTDYTKLIERLRNVGSPICITAAEAIEALQGEVERLTTRLKMTSDTMNGYNLQRAALEAKLGELQRQEPVGFMSPEQLELIRDPEDESGHYIPLRKTAAGNFVMALYAAPKALEPLTDGFLQSNDYRLLDRLIETTEDSEGYDITKTEIKRLADLGVVQLHGFKRYSVTVFGYWVHERYWKQNPSLPLKTSNDLAAEHSHRITKDTP